MKPFNDPLTNALANGANWQIFSTFFVAFVILAEPFEMSTSALSIVLVLFTLIFVLLSVREQAKVAGKEYERAILQRKVRCGAVIT